MNLPSLVIQAKLAEQAERYEDMATFMKQYVESGAQLTNDERNFFSVAFKNVVGQRRSSFRVLNSLMEYPDFEKTLCMDYRATIIKELVDQCNQVLELLDKYLIPSTTNDESKVFYLKMKGDYYRYLAEVTTNDDDLEKLKVSATESYKQAEEATAQLLATNPIKLGLALNHSVFYYEILSQSEQACKMAKEAFDAAIGALDTLNDTDYKDSTLIMQLLRDNLTLWSQDNEADDEDGV